MKVFSGLITFNRMPEFKLLINLAKWYLDMLQLLRRILSHMHSVTVTLKEPNCLNIRTNFKKRKILSSYTIVLIISHYTPFKLARTLKRVIYSYK